MPESDTSIESHCSIDGTCVASHIIEIVVVLEGHSSFTDAMFTGGHYRRHVEKSANRFGNVTMSKFGSADEGRLRKSTISVFEHRSSDQPRSVLLPQTNKATQ